MIQTPMDGASLRRPLRRAGPFRWVVCSLSKAVAVDVRRLNLDPNAKEWSLLTSTATGKKFFPNGLPGTPLRYSLFLLLLAAVALGNTGRARAATVTAAFPPYYTPLLPFQVALSVAPDPTTRVYSVEDNPPIGFTVSAISHGGVFDPSVGRVKWGPFSDAQYRVLSYRLTPPENATGTQQWDGRAAFDSTLVGIGGQRLTAKFPGTLIRSLPADYLPGLELTVTVSGVPAASVLVWVVEDQIPVGWQVTRISYSGVYDTGSGRVKWGPFLDTVPRLLTYTVSPPADARNDVTFSAQARFDDASLGDTAMLPIHASQKNSLVRSAPATYLPGVGFDVSLSVVPAPYVTLFVLEELLPAGWTPTDVTGSGIWDAGNRRLKWGPFVDASVVPATFRYRLTPGAGATAPLPLQATAIFGADTLVSASTIERFLAHTENTVVRRLPSHYVPGAALTVTNVATPIDTALVYAVEQEVPAGWSVGVISHGGAFDAGNRRVKWGPFFDGTATARELSCQWVAPSEAFGIVNFAGSSRFDNVAVSVTGDSSLGNAPATVVRTLPAGYVPEVTFAVTLLVTPVPGVVTYAVEETVPTGWGIGVVSDGGAFDAVNQKLKWGPFLDGNLRSLAYQLTPPNGATGSQTFAGQGTFNALAVASGGASDLPKLVPQVVGRWTFYNESVWDGYTAGPDLRDDAALATDKSALLPGQKAVFANYTSCARGINGIMVDILGLPAGVGLADSDFEFRLGNALPVSEWNIAPAPLPAGGVTLRRGAGTGGSDRITLSWGADAVKKQWLRIAVKATPATGLASDDVFYFGNAIGETGNSPTDAMVTSADALRELAHVAASASVVNPFDLNRDGKVGAADRLIVLGNLSVLKPLTLLNLASSPGLQGILTPSSVATPTGSMRRVGAGVAVRWPSDGWPVWIWTATALIGKEWELFDRVGEGRLSGETLEALLPIEAGEAGRFYRLESHREE